MKNITAVAGCIALFLIGTTCAFAQGPGYGPGPARAGYEGGIRLTPEQRTKFQELRRIFNEETAQVRGAMFTKRLELRSLWANPKSDPKAILEKERELRSLQDQMRDKAVQMRLEARGILTPEQFTHLGQVREARPRFGRRLMARGGRTDHYGHYGMTDYRHGGGRCDEMW